MPDEAIPDTLGYADEAASTLRKWKKGQMEEIDPELMYPMVGREFRSVVPNGSDTVRTFGFAAIVKDVADALDSDLFGAILFLIQEDAFRPSPHTQYDKAGFRWTALKQVFASLGISMRIQTNHTIDPTDMDLDGPHVGENYMPKRPINERIPRGKDVI